MSDGNVIDSLSLEIGASVNKSIASIKEVQRELGVLNSSLANFKEGGTYKKALDNLSTGFRNLAESVEWLDEGKLKSVSQGLSTLVKQANKINEAFGGTKTSGKTSGKNTAISQATAQLREYGKEIARQSWIESEEGLEASGRAFEEYAKKLSIFGEDAEATKRSFQGLVGTIQKFSKLDRDFEEDFADMPGTDIREYLNATNKGGSKILVNNDNEKGRFYARDRSVLGKAFTSSATSDHVDIETYVDEMNEALGTQIGYTLDENLLDGIVRNVENLKGKMKELSDAEIENTADTQMVRSAMEELIPNMQRLAELGSQATATFSDDSGGGGGGNGVSELASSLKEMNGLELPNFDSLKSLASSAKKLGGDEAKSAGANIHSFTDGLKGFGGDFTLPDFTNLKILASSVSKLGGENSKNAAWVLPNIMAELESFSTHFSGLNIDVGSLETIKSLGSAFSRLGGKNSTEAISNLPQLSDAVKKIVEDLNGLPQVNEKTQELVVALGNLAKANKSVGQGLNEVKTKTTGLNSVLGAGKQIVTNFANSFKQGYNSALTFGKGIEHVHKRTESLTMVIVKVRTLLWGLRRLFSAFTESISNASSLVEVQNVVENVYDASYIEEFDAAAQSAIKTMGMSELSFKQYASRYQAMGKALGITNTQMTDAEDRLKSMGVEYGVSTGKMADMSVNLTRLAADMASFYDVAQEDVYRDLQAIFTGQTRPLRQYGIDLTQTTLAEWAMKKGIDANFDSMTQAQKAMLRYQYVMDRSRASMNDFIRTSDTWHNQVTILKELFKALGVVIGSGLINALKPALKGFNIFLSSTIDFAQNVLNALGKIFGWEYEITGGGIADDTLADIEEMSSGLEDATEGTDDLTGGADDVADALDNANKGAEELKNTILGFDELNVLNDVSSALNGDSGTGGTGGSGSGSGTGSGSGIGGGGSDSNPISVAARKTKSAFESEIDNLYDLGKYMSDTLRKALDDINWDNVYEGARGFGTGLAQYLNGLLQPETFGSLGRTVAGGINTVLNALDSFGGEFDFYNLGVGIGTAINETLSNIDWDTAASAAVNWGRGLAEQINGYFDTTDFYLIGDTVASALNTAVLFGFEFSDNLDWEDIGTKLGDSFNGFFENFDADKFADGINSFVHGINDSIQSFLETVEWKEVFSKLGDLLSKIDWWEVMKAKLAFDLLGVGKGIAVGIATALGGNLVANILGGGINTVGTVLSTKIQNLVGGGTGTGGATATATGGATATGATGATGGGLAATFKSAGTALGTALSSGVAGSIAVGGIGIGAAILGIAGIMGMHDPEVQAEIQSGKDYIKKYGEDNEINMSASYQKMQTDSKGFWNTTKTEATTESGKVLESYDSMGRKMGVLVTDGTNTSRSSFREMWYDVTSKSGAMKNDIVEDTTQAWKIVTEKVEGLASNVKNAFEDWTSKVVPSVKETWETTKTDTHDRLEELYNDVDSSLLRTGDRIEEVLGDFPTKFSTWFGSARDEALLAMDDLAVNASNILSNVTSWLNDAISAASEAISYTSGATFGGYSYYASGGFPDAGEFFMARENGMPELVGRIGSRTAVANNGQIIEGIANGVQSAMYNVLMTTGGMNNGGSQPITNEFTFKVGEETIYQAVLRGKEMYERRYQTVASF